MSYVGNDTSLYQRDMYVLWNAVQKQYYDFAGKKVYFSLAFSKLNKFFFLFL